MKKQWKWMLNGGCYPAVSDLIIFARPARHPLQRWAGARRTDISGRRVEVKICNIRTVAWKLGDPDVGLWRSADPASPNLISCSCRFAR